MSGQQRHACIIGGGIIGLTCAVELRSRGWRVTLCDAAASAREASWAAAGMLAPFNEAHDRDTAWQRGLASLAAWEPFLRRHAIQPEAVDLRRAGALLPIDDDRAAARAEELLTLFADHGVRRLDSKHLRSLTTSVACAEALWLPGGQVDPRRATAAFFDTERSKAGSMCATNVAWYVFSMRRQPPSHYAASMTKRSRRSAVTMLCWPREPGVRTLPTPAILNSLGSP